MARPLSLPSSFAAAPIVHAIVASLGVFLALAVTLVLNKLEARHAIVILAGVVIGSAGLAMSRQLPDFLLYMLGALLPFTSIEKSFFVTQDTTFVVSGIAVGPADLALVALYGWWILRVVFRHSPLPRPSGLDWCILAFIAMHVLSAINSVSPVLTAYESLRLTKYALLCFFLEHNVERRHLKLLVAGICLAIVLESVLGVVQQRTGSLLGIGRTKGASDLEYEQYTVTGFEAVRRAEGTTFDSHALALFFAVSLAVPLALATTRSLAPVYRTAAAGTFMIGVAGLVVSFARAGWVAFAGSALVLVWFLARWREWRTLGLMAASGVALAVPAAIPFASQIRQRLFEAPPELVTARFETIEMAWQMFKDSPITGIGANAYMRALELKFSIFEGDPYFIPAHNMYVFILTELGVVGSVAFLVLVAAVIRTLYRSTSADDEVVRVLAVALLGGFVALLLQGLADPIYATNVTYYLIWFVIGLGAALARMTRAERSPGRA